MIEPDGRPRHTAGWLRESENGLVVEVRVRPRAPRECVVGVRAGRLRVDTTAAPVDDAANRRVVALLAKALGVPRTDVRIVAGATGRDKRIVTPPPTLRPAWLAEE